MNEEKKKIRNGIVSFVFGLFSIICSIPLWGLLGIPFGILGVTNSIRQKKIIPTGLSKTGMVLSIIGLCLALINIVAFAFMKGIWFANNI